MLNVRNQRRAASFIVLAWVECAAACREPASPTPPAAAATDNPSVTELKIGCYDASTTKREGRRAVLEFELRVDERGRTRSTLLSSDVDDPDLIACFLRNLDHFKHPPGKEPRTSTLKFLLEPPRQPLPPATPVLR